MKKKDQKPVENTETNNTTKNIIILNTSEDDAMTITPINNYIKLYNTP